jgi:hypothetical protein
MFWITALKYGRWVPVFQRNVAKLEKRLFMQKRKEQVMEGRSGQLEPGMGKRLGHRWARGL